MRAFTAAAVQLAPLPGPLTAESVEGNLAKAADWVDRCVEATGAELVVLPETASTGFTPGIGPEELWDLVAEIPGPVVEPLQEVARRARGARGLRDLRARPGARRRSTTRRSLVGPDGDDARRLPQDPPVLHRGRRRAAAG